MHTDVTHHLLFLEEAGKKVLTNIAPAVRNAQIQMIQGLFPLK
jgi:hypothetical protein